MPGESSDKKTWEKERRDRMKEAFATLEKLLPCYDPSTISTRINILNKSVEYIQEMQNRIEDLLKPNSKMNTEVLQLKKLQERIKRLLSRNELLSSLLREAKISIPNQGSSLRNFKYVYKWSGKINEKMAKGLQKNAARVLENDKENKSMSSDFLKAKPQKKTRNKLNSSSIVPKHRKNIVNRPRNGNEIQLKKKFLHPVTTNCFIIYTQACNTQPCYLVTNAPSNNFASFPQTVITNSLVASTPVMSTSIKATKKSVIQPTLGTSTLILANGTLYPVLPQSQPILPTRMVFQVANSSNTEVTKSESNQNMKAVDEVSTSKIDTQCGMKNAPHSSVDKLKAFNSINVSKEFPIIGNSTTSSNVPGNNMVTLSAKDVILSKNVPIRPNRCVTRTTHINKVPIPALASNYCTSILIPEISKPTEVKKAVRARRIGSRPMGRLALRKFRKMVHKRKMEVEADCAKKMKLENFINNSNEKIIDEKLTGGNRTTQKNNLNSSMPLTNNYPVVTKGISTIMSLESVQQISKHNVNPIHKHDEQECNNSKIKSDGKRYKIPILSNDIIKVATNSQTSSLTTNSVAPESFCLESSQELEKKYQKTNISKNNSQDINKNSLNGSIAMNISVDNLNTLHPLTIEQSHQSNEISGHTLNIDSRSIKITQNISSSNPKFSGDSQNKQQTQNNQISVTGRTENLNGNPGNFLGNHQTIENHSQRTENNPNVDNVCNLNQHIKNFDLQLGNSELSNDIFASLQVPPGCQNPESTSPTAAFLLAFPLVSSLTGVKVAEVMEDDNPDSQRETPTLMQIGTLDTNKPTQSPNLFNLDNLSFFSSKDIYSGLYNSFEQHLNALTMSTNTFMNDSSKLADKLTVSTSLPKAEKNGDQLKVTNVVENLPPQLSTSSVTGTTKQSTLREKKTYNIETCKLPSSRTINDGQFNLSNKLSNKSVDRIIHQPSPSSHNISTQTLFNGIDENKNIDTTAVQTNLLIQGDIFVGSKTTGNSNKHVKQNPFISISQNVQSTVPKNMESHKYFIGDSVTPMNNVVDQSIFHNFCLKKENLVTSITQASGNQNIFNIDNRTSQIQSSQKNLELSNVNFPLQKQNFPVQKNLDGQIYSQNSDLQPILQKNFHNTELSFGENRNSVPISSQSNFGHNLFIMESTIPTCLQKNVNYKNLPCNAGEKYSGTQKDSNRTFFTSEMVPPMKNINVAENIHVENRMNEPLQKNIYNNINTEYKNVLPAPTQKLPDINFSFNLGNTVPPPLQKTVESKQMFSNYSMNDTNINYDLNSITKVCTCVYSMNKKFPDPLYTNSNNNNYNYYSNSENFLNENCSKNTKMDKTIGSIDFDNLSDFRKIDFTNTYYDHNFQKNIAVSSKSNNNHEKMPYNWMTTPSKNSVEHTVLSLPKEDVHSSQNIVNNNQTTYFNTSIYPGEINCNLGQTTRKTLDLPLMNMNTHSQRNDVEENHFTWSPSKIPQYLDPVPTFVSSTLPTLVGDLALGTSSFTDQKTESANKYPNIKDVKNKTTSKFNQENQNNLFSVSQLVHQNKEIKASKPARRRSSGSGSKGNPQKNKKASKTSEDQKDIQPCFSKSSGNQGQGKIDSKNLICGQPSNNVFCDSNKRNPVKISSSNYTAEALIGHQGNSEVIAKRDQLSSSTVKNTPLPPFISDNIMPYFPAIDLPQDNFIQQNQNYQNFSHNFTTFPNTSYAGNTFIPSCSITTNYLSTNTFMPDLGSGHEFSTSNMNLFPNAGLNKDNKFKNTSKSNTNGREEKFTHGTQCPSNVGKKVKRKVSNESNATANFVDFSFLSIPGNINSPLLPDDFHSHGPFLPPPPTQPQLFSCKNPLYSAKQSNTNSAGPLLPLPPIPSITRAGIQHPEISPSLNSGGTSLTNFNLSTIFPEINKGSMSEIYSDNRIKEQPSVTSHYSNSSVPFNSKPIISYSNCQTTQAYGTNNR